MCYLIEVACKGNQICKDSQMDVHRSAGGKRMKNRSYYILFVVYAIVVAFVLYVNGVFTGEQSSLVNLAINIGFLIVIGVLFLISAVSFGRLNSVTDELSAFAARRRCTSSMGASYISVTYSHYKPPPGEKQACPAGGFCRTD